MSKQGSSTLSERIADHGPDLVVREPLPSAQMAQLKKKREAGDAAFQSPRQSCHCQRGPAPAENIIHDEDPRAGLDAVTVNLEDWGRSGVMRALGLRRLIGLLESRSGQLAGLPDGDEPNAEGMGQRGSHNEAERIGP